MDALALFSLKQLPKAQPIQLKRAPKRFKQDVELKNSIQYICDSCNSAVFLSGDDDVQCSNCDNRIVHKLKSKTPKSYNAV